MTRYARFWAWVPALLLGSMLLGLGTLAHIAIDDPHFALEPNYYDKAVHWDRTRAEASDSRALGLRVSSSAPSVGADGSAELELRVLDAKGAPFASAAVEVDAFPNAFATRRQHVTLREAAPGVYRAKLEHTVPGLWELRVVVTRGAARYHEALRPELRKAGAA
jgi:nitrogen fixation protein FixH